MTCIAGIAQDNTVWIGGDSAGVAGLSLQIRQDPKVFIVENLIFGFTSSFRMGQLLNHCFVPPTHEENKSIEAYLCGPFVDAVRQCFKDGGYIYKNNERESGGVFLLGYKGRLFYVDSDFQVGENKYGFHAIGCGADIALGAMSVLKNKPETRIKKALKAASQFSAGVSEPFIIKALQANLVKAHG